MTGAIDVTVVIPTRLGDGLERAVASALEQEGVSVEVIVVVNGGDRDIEFLDGRVRVLRSESSHGANGARQLGIDEARADVVALLDDDDEWLPKKLAAQLDTLRRLEADGGPWIVGCRVIEERVGHPPLTIPKTHVGDVGDVATFLFARPGFHSDRPQLQTSSLIFSTALGREHPFDHRRAFHQDWSWLLDAERGGARAYLVPEAFVRRIVTVGPSISSKITWRQSAGWAAEYDLEPQLRSDFLLTMAAGKAARVGDRRGLASCMRLALKTRRVRVATIVFWLSLWKPAIRASRGKSRIERTAEVSTGRHVFVRATGQAENVGDSLLRRGLVKNLRQYGTVHVLLRALDDDYISGLDLHEDDIIYRDDREWTRAARAHARTGRVVFAFNAGEIQMNRYYVRQYWSYLPAMLAARRSGGHVLHLGVGIRAARPVWRPAFVPLMRLFALNDWRDDYSRTALAAGGVMPDWAFGEGPDDAHLRASATADRNVLAVTMRGDRPVPSARWFDTLREVADRDGLTITTFAQVRADIDRAREIATRLGGSFVDCGGTDHRTWERNVRDLCASSTFVVSDRLHALVIAATEGAIPIGLSDHGAEKAVRHFAVIGRPDISAAVRKDSGDALRAFDGSGAARTALVEQVIAARARIDGVVSRIGELS